LRPWGITATYIYLIHANGEVDLSVSGKPVVATPGGSGIFVEDGPSVLPRIGLELHLPVEYSTANWYGRGPGESYVDTLQANRVGQYTRTVDELWTNCVYPQENGNRSDVRWVNVVNSRGTGLLAVGQPELNFSLQRYTVAEIERAKHTNELRQADHLIWHLDYQQRGIGSASCGPDVLPQHDLRNEPFSFSLRMMPV
jgi:beta-galactosidase/evolved beta-galactosidase subunit alpha